MRGTRYNKKLTKKEIAEQNYRRQVYAQKIEEYTQMTLEELKAIYNNPDKRLGGLYREALLQVTADKMRADKIKQAVDNAEVVEASQEAPKEQGEEQTT